MIDGDVARYAEEDFLADLLDVAVESIRSAADEVDDAFGDVVRRRFEVDDDGLAVADVIGNALRIIKGFRFDDDHAQRFFLRCCIVDAGTARSYGRRAARRTFFFHFFFVFVFVRFKFVVFVDAAYSTY